jgi:signal peptidase I
LRGEFPHHEVENDWNSKRLNGFTNVKRDEIVVFYKDESKNSYVKRCVGLPGESIRINRGELIINGFQYHPPPSVKRYYKVWFNNAADFAAELKKMNISFRHPRTGEKYIGITLNEEERKETKELSCIDSISIKINYPETIDSIAYPRDGYLNWTVDNLGEFIIPLKDMNIPLNHRNFILYKAIVNTFEGGHLVERNGCFFLNDNMVIEYTFKKNYYFMMGDNRNNSGDSRYFGLVPEDGIIGKAVVILFSVNRDGLNLKRSLILL